MGLKYVYSLLSIYIIWILTSVLLGSKNILELSSSVSFIVMTIVSLLPIYLMKKKEGNGTFYIWIALSTLIGVGFIVLCKILFDGDYHNGVAHTDGENFDHPWDSLMFVGVATFYSIAQLIFSLVIFLIGLIAGKKEMDELLDTDFDNEER